MVHSHSTVLNAAQTSGGREQVEELRVVSWPEQEFNGFLEAAPDAVVIADRGLGLSVAPARPVEYPLNPPAHD
jgi:hypothetical protein